MREIKFRGKRKTDGAWIYGDLVHRAFDGCCRMMDIGIKPLACYPVEVIPETVGQFIGRHDKHGKEMYEGDTIKAVSKNSPRIEITGKIVYGDGEYEVETTDDKWPVASIVILEDFEVIDNE